MSSSIQLLPSLLRGALALLFVLPVHAGGLVDVPPGDIGDGAGGPFLAGVTYKLNGLTRVPPGSVLTVQEGAVVKCPGSLAVTLIIEGELRCEGTELDPIVFTSYDDDTAGVDIGGGLSFGQPGQWSGIQFLDTSDASVLEHVELRFGGAQGFQPCVRLFAADVTLRDCAFTDNAAAALELDGACRPTVVRCAFERNGRPIVNAPLDALRGFLDNTAADNVLHDYVDIPTDVEKRFFEDADLGPENVLNGVLPVHWGLTVTPGVTVTLRDGLVVKLEHGAGASLGVQGALRLRGTAAEPVVVTSIRDDAFGGDTNHDGAATQPAPGDWDAIRPIVGGPAVVEIEHARLRFGGDGALRNGASSAILSLDVRDTVVERSSGAGFDFAGSNEVVCVRSTARDNGGVAMRGASFEMLADFADNVADGNAGGDYLRVQVGSTSLVASVTVEPASYPGDVLVLDGGFTLGGGTSLTFAPGVRIKSLVGGQIVCPKSAVLRFDGTATQPITLTAIADDAFGDTNLDGALTVPVPGQGLGVRYVGGPAPALGSRLRHVEVRYAFGDGVTCSNETVEIGPVRVTRSAGTGVVASKLAGSLRGVEAIECGGDGIACQGSGIDVRNATVYACTGAGIRRSSGTASVSSSIAWANVGGNFAGLSSADVHHSCGGFAGVNGNLDVVPGFADAPNGDLTLDPLSPCVEAGDPSEAFTGPDAGGMPALLDGDLDGVQVVDMGANEFSNVELVLTGDASVGGTFFLEAKGTPGLPTLLGFGPSAGQVPVPKVGTIFFDPAGGFFTAAFPSSPAVVPVTLAGPATFTAQLVVVGGGGANLSNAVLVDVQ